MSQPVLPGDQRHEAARARDPERHPVVDEDGRGGVDRRHPVERARSPRTSRAVKRSDDSIAAAALTQPYRPSRAYSSLGSMFVAIAMRLVRLYIEAISATSHASSSVRPAMISVLMSARVMSRGVRVSFSA